MKWVLAFAAVILALALVGAAERLFEARFTRRAAERRRWLDAGVPADQLDPFLADLTSTRPVARFPSRSLNRKAPSPAMAATLTSRLTDVAVADPSHDAMLIFGRSDTSLFLIRSAAGQPPATQDLCGLTPAGATWHLHFSDGSVIAATFGNDHIWHIDSVVVGLSSCTIDRCRPDRRHDSCAEAWPDCTPGAYDPDCCRFPKSCSCENFTDRLRLEAPAALTFAHARRIG